MATRFETFRNRMKAAPSQARAAWHMGRSTGMMWELRPRGIVQLLRMINRDYQNPSAVFTMHAKNQPDRVALRFRGRGLTYAELDDRIDRLASGLVSRGLQRKQAVLVMMKNRPEFVEIGAAAGRVGAAAVSVSWRSTPAELAYLAGNSGARFIFFDHELAHVIEHAREKVDLPSDRFIAVGGDVPGCTRYEDCLGSQKQTLEGDDEGASVVTYTSGTTGKPKGAVRRFPREMFAMILEFVALTPIRCDDVHLVVCPMYHMTAWAFCTMTFAVGGTVVIADEFKPESFLELVEKERVTTTAMVPTMLSRLVPFLMGAPPANPRENLSPLRSASRSSGESAIHARRTRSLRAIFCGGAQLQGQLAIQAMDLLGDVVFNFYGATELGIVTLASPADLRAAPGTIGPIVPGNEVLLLDDQKNPVKDGDVGELFVKNVMLVAGYHGNEDAMRESMHAGYFSVGDLARRDGDGRFFIEGRKRDMVITGGVNVYPAEVENAIEEHPQVLEAAVVGVPDPEWGERVKAFVVAKSGERIDGEQLKQFLRERIAGPKIPREYAFIDALPRNPTGKVLKNELRTRA